MMLKNLRIRAEEKSSLLTADILAGGTLMMAALH